MVGGCPGATRQRRRLAARPEEGGPPWGYGCGRDGRGCSSRCCSSPVCSSRHRSARPRARPRPRRGRGRRQDHQAQVHQRRPASTSRRPCGTWPSRRPAPGATPGPWTSSSAARPRPAAGSPVTPRSSRPPRRSPASVDIPSPSVNFEGIAGRGEHPDPRRHPDPARPGRRRRPQPLRRDGQHRLGGLLQDRHAAARPAQPGLDLGRLRGAGLRGQLRRPDRAARPAGQPLDPDPVHHRRPPTFYNCVAVSTSRRPDRQLLPLRVLHRRQLPRLPQVRRLAATPTSRPPASSRPTTLRRHRRLRAGAGQDAHRQPGRPRRLGPGRARHRRPGVPDR